MGVRVFIQVTKPFPVISISHQHHVLREHTEHRYCSQSRVNQCIQSPYLSDGQGI